MRGNEGLLQCMLQKTLKQGVGKWCPSTTGPLLPTTPPAYSSVRASQPPPRAKPAGRKAPPQPMPKQPTLTDFFKPTSTAAGRAEDEPCDKPGFNGTFKGELEEEYAMWAEENIMGQTRKQGPVPQHSRKEVANWVVHAFAAITDDAIREACRTAYFPSGLKLSQLEDTEFFKKHDPESDSDDGSQTDTDDSGDSDDSSGVDDSDSDDARECDVVWAKSGRGVWGLCHVFEDTLYLTRDLMEDSAIPSNLSVPKVSDSDGAATSARAKKSPKPGEHVQLFRMKRDRNKGFYSEKC